MRRQLLTVPSLVLLLVASPLFHPSGLLGLALGGTPAEAASRVTGPRFSASPNPLQFEPVALGAAWRRYADLTITNNGDKDLLISSYSFQGDNAFSEFGPGWATLSLPIPPCGTSTGEGSFTPT